MGGVARVNLRRSLEMLFLVTAESDEAAHGRESLLLTDFLLCKSRLQNGRA
jgi:hypothetical protein